MMDLEEYINDELNRANAKRAKRIARKALDKRRDPKYGVMHDASTKGLKNGWGKMKRKRDG
jgi:hypothetical protein